MWRWLLLVDPRIFWAPGPPASSTPVVPGVLACARRVGSLSGPAAHECRSPQPDLPISPVPQPGHPASPAPSTPAGPSGLMLLGALP